MERSITKKKKENKARYLDESYWSGLIERDLPVIGKLYRFRTGTLSFPYNTEESNGVRRRMLDWLSEGDIVMLVWAEDKLELAKQLVRAANQDEVVKEGKFYFNYQLLWGEKLSAKLFCSNAFWLECFEPIETALL